MVRGKKMKNPLRKRLPRELKTEFGKYLDEDGCPSDKEGKRHGNDRGIDWRELI